MYPTCMSSKLCECIYVWMVLLKWRSWRFSAVAIWSVDYSCPRVWANFSPSRPPSGSYARQTFHASTPLSPQAPPLPQPPKPPFSPPLTTQPPDPKPFFSSIPSGHSLSEVVRKLGSGILPSCPAAAIHAGKWTCTSLHLSDSFSYQLYKLQIRNFWRQYLWLFNEKRWKISPDKSSRLSCLCFWTRREEELGAASQIQSIKFGKPD